MTGCAPIRSAIKKTAHASEQERADVQAKRYRWRKRQDWLKQHEHLLSRIVFIDETGLNTKMARPRGRSARGQRLVASIPHGHWKTMTFIGGLRHDGIERVKLSSVACRKTVELWFDLSPRCSPSH